MRKLFKYVNFLAIKKKQRLLKHYVNLSLKTYSSFIDTQRRFINIFSKFKIL